jgi:hypothetical protein
LLNAGDTVRIASRHPGRTKGDDVERIVADVHEILPRPPLTRNQVELLQVDTTASEQPGFRELRISPRSLEEALQAMLGEATAWLSA